VAAVDDDTEYEDNDTPETPDTVKTVDVELHPVLTPANVKTSVVFAAGRTTGLDE